MSTNKVYGDNPNFLPLIEKKTKIEIKKPINTTSELMKLCL